MFRYLELRVNTLKYLHLIRKVRIFKISFEMNAVNISRDFLKKFANEQDVNIFSNSSINADNSSEFGASVNFSEAELQYNAGNTTFSTANWRDTYKIILDFLLFLALISIMLAMGCEIKWKNLLDHIKRPSGLCIGMISQFGIMPLSAYSILRIIGIRGFHATGVLIISCCPGGGMSNMFSYFFDGDLPLSVAMTSVSTLMAVGMMPLNVWLYGRYFESDDLVIPYGKLAMSLIMVALPVLLGMLAKWKFPVVASFGKKLGIFCGVLLVCITNVMEIVVFPEMFTGVPIKVYIVILSLPIAGMTLGYGFATVTRRNIPVRKAISIECGIQNVPLAFTVITLSFSIEIQAHIVVVPLLYSFFMVTTSTVVCSTYQTYKRCFQKSSEENETGIAVKKVPLLEGKENQDSISKSKIEIEPCKEKNGKLNSLNSILPDADSSCV